MLLNDSPGAHPRPLLAVDVGIWRRL